MSKNLFLLSLLVSLSCLENSIPSKNLQKVPRKLEDYITAELTFVKAYDLTFSDRYWQFKIEVKDDDNLKENDKLKLDFVAKEDTSYTNGYVDCTFKARILSCGEGDLADKNTNVIKLSSVKNLGSITWKNLNEQYISIPLNHTFTFKNAYGAFYTDKWHFLIKATNTGISPKYSSVIIDLIQNTKETTATCQLLNEGSENNEEDIYCISDYPYQSSSDELKLNTNKKYGSIQWKENINESNSIIAKAVENKANTLELVDAYDLHYSKYNWIFTIEAKNPTSREVGIYKADISITSSTGETKNTAKCLLYDGINSATTNVKLICSIQRGGQAHKELIKLISKESGSITWAEGFTSPQTITLKTELRKERDYGYDNKGEGNKWTFKIEVSDGILPVNSKVIVGIIKADNALDQAICQADSSTLLSCKTEDASTKRPEINLVKTEDSSVTWKKYESNLLLNVKYVSKYEYDINLEQFKFNMTILDEGIPLNTLTIINVYYYEGITSYPSWGSCILIESNKFACSVVWEQQKSSGWIAISTYHQFKSPDTNVLFMDHLFYGRAYKTKFIENKWKFNVELTDSNLKEGDNKAIDIKVDNALSTANCVVNENLLSCEASAADQKKESNIYIIRNKDNKLLIWHDLPEEGVLLYLEYKMKYKTANGGLNKNNRWEFNLWYEPLEANNNNIGLYTSIDITVNGDPKIAECEITESPYLICSPLNIGNDNEDVIKIIGNKAPYLGSGIFEPLLSEEIQIKPVSIELEYESLQMELYNGVLLFNLIGKLANDITTEIEEDSYTGLELTKKGETDTLKDVACFTNKIGKSKGSNVNITCESYSFRDEDEIALYRDDKGYSGYVKIIHEGTIDLKPSTDDTTDKKDDGDNGGNGDKDKENSSKYYQHIIVYLLLLILF